MRSWIKITLVVLIVATVGLSLYFIFKRARVDIMENPPLSPPVPGLLPILPQGGGVSSDQATSTADSEGGGGGETPARPGRKSEIALLSDFPAFDFWVNPSTEEVVYLTRNGEVYVAREGEDESLSSETFPLLVILRPAPDRMRALLATIDAAGNLLWVLFDRLDQSWRPLPSDLLDVVWGPGRDTLIARRELEPGVEGLVRLDASKSSFPRTTLLPSLPLHTITMQTTGSSTMLLLEHPSAKTDGRAWELNLARGTLSLLLTPTPGMMLSARWGEPARFFSAYPKEFRILDTKTLRTVAAPPFFTLPPKCAAEDRVAFCFAPRMFSGLLTSLVLPDDWLSGAALSTDDLYRTDLDSGNSERVLVSGEGNLPALDVERIEVVRGTVYLLDRRGHAVYRITLPASVSSEDVTTP